MSNALSLNISVTHPSFLLARSCSKAIGGLVVYISPVVRETDPIYRPIADLLKRVRHVLVFEERMRDINMMFSEATLRVYRFIDSLDIDPEIPPFDEVYRDRGLRALSLLSQ